MKGFLKLCAVLFCATALRAEALPDAATLLKRMQARLEFLCDQPPTNRFFYNRTNLIEELDGGGKLKKKSEKVYDVTLLNGLPRARVVAIDGRRLAESEQRWRTSEEQRLHRILAPDKAPDQSKPKPWLTDDVLERFNFVVTGKTNHQQRALFTMKFVPREDAPAKTMPDRIINKVSGLLWIDEQESEIVRLDLQMTEPVKFWGGILGQLDRFDWTLWRGRSDVGAWYNQTSRGLFQVRKLFSTTRYRFSEASSALSKNEPL